MSENSDNGKAYSTLVDITEKTMDDSLVSLKGTYRPTIEHCEGFVALTGDENPIHQRHPKYGEAVSPGFMQVATSLLLARDMSFLAGPKSLNLPDCSYEEFYVDMNGALLTGLEYSIVADQRLEKDSITSRVKFTDAKGVDVCEFESVAAPSFSGNNPAYGVREENKIYECDLMVPRTPLNSFSSLMGSAYPEDIPFFIAASSAVVTQAIKEGVLSMDFDKAMAMYARQDISIDFDRKNYLGGKIGLELYLENPEKFGQLSAKDETMPMTIVGKDQVGGVFYKSTAPLSFQKSKLLDLMMRKGFGKKK